MAKDRGQEEEMQQDKPTASAQPVLDDSTDLDRLLWEADQGQEEELQQYEPAVGGRPAFPLPALGPHAGDHTHAQDLRCLTEVYSEYYDALLALFQHSLLRAAPETMQAELP